VVARRTHAQEERELKERHTVARSRARDTWRRSLLQLLVDEVPVHDLPPLVDVLLHAHRLGGGE
jgi:hypothetical protein